MKIIRKFSISSISYLFIFSTLFFGHAQDQSANIIEKFETYTEFPREISYAHLNKSILAKGEMLGFTVYTFDKFAKTPSTATTNIYCTITDKNEKVIKNKLVRAVDGVAFNVFNVDSLFTSGTYKFRAYTNWMLNFDENNHFSSYFTVLDSSTDEQTKNTVASKIDLQLLPEGGHLIGDCQNSVAIIAKNSEGRGIPNLTGDILNSQNNIVTSFQLNEYGIGKTILIPSNGEKYKLTAIYNNELVEIPIDNIKSFGFNMSAIEARGKLILNFKTNSNSLKSIKDEVFNIVIHNGSELNSTPFSFNNLLQVNRVFDTSILFKGMNVITIFDSNNKPVLERLFFNYTGINNSDKLNINFDGPVQDSITLKIRSKVPIKTEDLTNLSISILPNGTESYNFDHSIFSALYLKPYIKGPIEDASYYFTNVNPKVKYDLDNLLISQGWSSYDWNTIFNYPPLISNDFEFGISTLVNINEKDKEGVYVSYPLTNSSTQIFNLEKGDSSFKQRGLYPLKDEMYSISKTSVGDKSKKPQLYIQFFPSEFPSFTLKNEPLLLNTVKKAGDIGLSRTQLSLSWENDAEILDEVLITANKKDDRNQQIKSQHFGKVNMFDDAMRRSNMTFAMYISNYGYNATEARGTLSIAQRNPTSSNVVPLIYLDDVLLADFTILYQFRMNIVDYVVVDQMGASAGIRGSAGVIKIYTDPKYNFSVSQRDLIAEFDFPINFSSQKKYYAPLYQTYSDDFYKKYGAIDWIPNVQLDEQGRSELKIRDNFQNKIEVFIEGFINTNTFISEHKTIILN